MSHEASSATTPTDPRIGMVLQDRYRILRKLGEGGMGAVYEGEHTLIKRRVAIKCLHAQFAASPEIVARFHREALAATSIRHPNIVEVTDMGRFPDGAFFMVLEFLEGHDWAHELDTQGPQPLSRVVHIMSQVCDALAAAHDAGIVHRDLKPENIFLVRRGTEHGFVKVLDFGVSKMRGQEGADGQPPAKNLTRTGTAMGTPYYMSPEQAQGKVDVDHRTDIYALGVILFQALTGTYPFDDESYPMLIVKVCMHEAPRLDTYRSDLPPEIAALVASMLAKSPAQRPASCAAIKAALVPFAGHGGTPVLQQVPPAPSALDAGTFPPTATPMTRTGPTSPPTRVSGTPAGTPAASPRVAIAIVGAAMALVATLGIGAVIFLVSRPGAPIPAAALPAPPPPRAIVPEPPAPVPAPAAAPPPVVPAPAIAVATAPPAPAATVRVQLTTEPSDAEVYLDDHRIPNPFDADLPQTSTPRNLRVQREGYTTQVQDLVLEFPQRIAVRLQRGRGVEDRSSRHRSPDAPSTTAPTAPTADRAAARATPAPAAEAPPAGAPPAEAPPAEASAPASPPAGERAALKNPFGHH